MPISFTLPIRFQQTSDPDAVEFNIGTQFFLLAQKDVWLSNETNKVMEQSDAAFSLGTESLLLFFVPAASITAILCRLYYCSFSDSFEIL